MKQVRILILGVIGMMAFTATATTTAKLEEKQKTVFIDEVTFSIESVSVVSDFEFIAADAVQIFQSYALPLKAKNDLKSSFAIVSDVGWQSSEIRYTSIHYKEKLLENYDLKFTDKRKQNLRIRSDC